MKKIVIIGLICLMGSAMAQTSVTEDAEVGGRLSLGINKKIVKGLHVNLEEEVRFDNNFASFDRFHTTLAVHYKVLPYLKVGLGYALINSYDATDAKFNTPRHRLFVDVMGSYRFGDWSLSLRERLQTTHRTDSFNEWQNPQNTWMLKSRLKLTYKGFRRWEPYGSFELRNTLNAPVINATYNEATDTWLTPAGSTTGEAGWFLEGFNGVDVNRLRGMLGVSYRLDRSSTLEVYLIADYTMEKELDANAKGTKLKSYSIAKGFNGWVGASYSYTF